MPIAELSTGSNANGAARSNNNTGARNRTGDWQRWQPDGNRRLCRNGNAAAAMATVARRRQQWIDQRQRGSSGGTSGGIQWRFFWWEFQTAKTARAASPAEAAPEASGGGSSIY